jgi:hypothetical protein
VGHLLYRGTLTPSREIRLDTREVHTEQERIQASTEGWASDPRVAEREARERGVVYEFPLTCFRGVVDDAGRRLLEERLVHDQNELDRLIAERWTTDHGQAVRNSELPQLQYLERQQREEQDADRRLRALQLQKLSRELDTPPPSPTADPISGAPIPPVAKGTQVNEMLQTGVQQHASEETLAALCDRLGPIDAGPQRRAAVTGKLERVSHDTGDVWRYDADFLRAAKQYQDRKTLAAWLKRGAAASPSAHEAFCRVLLLSSTEFVAVRNQWKKKPKRGSRKNPPVG